MKNFTHKGTTSNKSQEKATNLKDGTDPYIKIQNLDSNTIKVRTPEIMSKGIHILLRDQPILYHFKLQMTDRKLGRFFRYFQEKQVRFY